MRVSNPAIREQLRRTLRTSPRRSSTELARTLAVTPQTARRLLSELPAEVLLAAGMARRSRYALRRPLRGLLENLSLYSVDASGRAEPMAALAIVEPEGTLLPLADTPWPIPPESRDGWWRGLPYPVYAIRPQGYLGRQLASATHRDLGVSRNPDEWSDDDILWVLSQRGADVPGNLLLGNNAYELWIRGRVEAVSPLPAGTLAYAYVELAQKAVSAGGGGSGAAGEFPKFGALRDLDGATTPHVLVKFSGAGGSDAERRWADLLVCEHRALECAATLPGLRAARSRILVQGGRVFIEVERFDRIGLHGRLPLCAFDAIAPAFLGARSQEWPDLCRRMAEQGLLDAASVVAVEHLWWFGRLIANTDMHLGNLSFHVERGFRLAPVYDMLPMAYAPLAGGEVPLRELTTPLPLPTQRATWLTSCAAAVWFWNDVARDERISSAFRVICGANASRLSSTADRV